MIAFLGNRCRTILMAMTCFFGLIFIQTRGMGAAEKNEQPHFGDPEWPEKAHDSIRYSLITNDYLGAWRSVQLLKRTGIGIDFLDYYEKLSATLAGACPFSLAPEPIPFDHLLRAYSARFYRKFNSAQVDPIKPMELADTDITSLNASQTPYLSEINRMKLLKGRGCRLSRPSFQSEESAEREEFRHLKQYVTHVKSGRIAAPANHVRVQIRLLELAARLHDDPTATNLLNELTSLDPSHWIDMSEANRRFLWTMLQENGRVPESVVLDGSEEDRIVETVIRASSKREVTYWLAIAPIDQWSFKRKREVFKVVDGLGPFPGRSAVILRRAIISHAEQKPRESLEFIRRILRQDETSLKDSQEDSSAEESTLALTLQLVEKLLGEYRYDQAVLASIKTSVPSTYWRRVYRGLLLQYAIRGDTRGYNQLKAQLFKDEQGIWKVRMTDETLAVLDAMVHRSISNMSKSLQSIAQLNRTDFIRLAKDVAIRVAGYGDDDFRAVAPVLTPFIPLLEKERASGRQSSDTEDVIRILGRFRQDRADRTETAVHGGITHAGAANIRPLLNLSNPFVWTPLNRLPLTNLLAMPDEARNRSWSIQ